MFIRDHEYEPTLQNRLRCFFVIYFFKERCMTLFDIMDIRVVFVCGRFFFWQSLPLIKVMELANYLNWICSGGEGLAL